MKHVSAVWRIIVKSCSLNLYKELTQIKDRDLEKLKRLLWFSPVLTYCVCISVQYLHVFNAHTQLEGGSTHSVLQCLGMNQGETCGFILFPIAFSKVKGKT